MFLLTVWLILLVAYLTDVFNQSDWSIDWIYSVNWGLGSLFIFLWWPITTDLRFSRDFVDLYNIWRHRNTHFAPLTGINILSTLMLRPIRDLFFQVFNCLKVWQRMCAAVVKETQLVNITFFLFITQTDWWTSSVSFTPTEIITNMSHVEHGVRPDPMEKTTLPPVNQSASIHPFATFFFFFFLTWMASGVGFHKQYHAVRFKWAFSAV